MLANFLKEVTIVCGFLPCQGNGSAENDVFIGKTQWWQRLEVRALAHFQLSS